MSKPQEILGLFLEKLGLIVEGETKIGKHRVDFWLPELRTAVEWDGPWHMFTKADEKRDEALKEFGVKEVIRVNKWDGATRKWLCEKLGAEDG